MYYMYYIRAPASYFQKSQFAQLEFQFVQFAVVVLYYVALVMDDTLFIHPVANHAAR